MCTKIIIQPRHEISNNVVCVTSKVSEQPAHTRSLIRAFVSRLNILLLKIKRGCAGWSESTLVKMPHCWKSHVAVQLLYRFFRSLIYPFLVKSGKTMGLRVFLNAVVFCMLNGYLQSSYLMYHAKFGKDWLFRINVLVGEISSFFVLFWKPVYSQI